LRRQRADGLIPMLCRSCSTPVAKTVLDLGTAPPSNAYVTDLQKTEQWLPLRVGVCERCWLAQTEDFVAADKLFDADYAYFSSTSTTWLAHAKRYVDTMVSRFGLNASSLVLEVAANDGYLLQYVQECGIPNFGIDPTLSTATAARAKGLEIITSFFGKAVAEGLRAKGRAVDLLTANNVFAHVPDVNDFTAGIAAILKPQGVATIEVAHILSLIRENQFDTIYHEHYSYWSLAATEHLVARHDLRIFDVELLPTHGGSLRMYMQHAETGQHTDTDGLARVRGMEAAAGMQSLGTYAGMQPRADQARDGLVRFLTEIKAKKQSICAYGAAAKGNTLLNFARVGPDLLPWVADASPSKQGKYLPGSHIPIAHPDRIATERPDWIFILPWNIKNEIMQQLRYTAEWKARFAVAIPALQTFDPAA